MHYYLLRIYVTFDVEVEQREIHTTMIRTDIMANSHTSQKAPLDQRQNDMHIGIKSNNSNSGGASSRAAVILFFLSSFIITTAMSTTNTNNNNNANKLRRGWLIVDFDGTCTIRDTTPLLPHLTSLVVKRQQQQNEEEDEVQRKKKEM
eukprot:15227109-Ditylum_brightwellii.AAC.1